MSLGTSQRSKLRLRLDPDIDTHGDPLRLAEHTCGERELIRGDRAASLGT